MKLKLLSFLLLFVVLLSSISAASISMKTNFSQGETLIAKISGNFYQSITADQVLFYKQNTRIPSPSFIQKFGNDYYVYTQLSGKAPDNYSMVIQNVKYYNGDQLITSDLSQNFMINNNTADFYINPGFVTSSGIFYLNLQNLQNNPLTINYGPQGNNSISGNTNFFSSLFGGSNSPTNQNSITLSSGELRNISFSSDNFSQGLNIFELSSPNTIYDMPLYVSSQNNYPSTQNPQVGSMQFQPTFFNITISTNSNTSRILNLINTGNIDLNNVLISVSPSLLPYVNLSTQNIADLIGNSTQQVQASFISDNQTRILQGQITATSGNISSYVSILLNFIPSYQPFPGVNSNTPTIQTCSQLGGNFCLSNQQCNTNVTYASDGVCCVGSCINNQTSYSTGWIIGWSILILIIIVAVIIYFKTFKKKKPNVDLLKIAQRKK